ncbi:sulfite exporter TauE/SafE family protein [Paraglaciecola aquimarina]|uniref:Sulfite exporter TauE/SafE family protein n=1 Tax=Paraglaciecola aquimarina TaxID=1235557 RepID=A0ABU3SYJ7_9ALTE|nr:sulfite exporter TauE/SafE family protein [Paraglaciecola aquimarina]MDU0355089.1 sulfite exporter TauE/SafE family protein [Paraglaciecola aquimarina]
MYELSFFSAMLIGLAGGVHCAGMCGGIVGAFSYALPKNASLLAYSLTYNFGRILSYTLAGGLTGWLGQIFSNQIHQGVLILQFIGSVFLVLLAFYVTGWWRGLVKLEKIGSNLWKWIRPWSTKLLPFKTPLHALPYGMIWGWLPCGLIYSSLTWSLASGSAINGALLMFGFGLGTLPIMILMALGFDKVKSLAQHPNVKLAIGLLLLIFASLQILNLITSSV